MQTNTKIVTEDQTIYLGIDYHKNTSTLCFKDQQGKTSRNQTVKTSDLSEVLKCYSNLEIAIETTGGSNHMAEVLRVLGHQVYLVNTNKAKAVGMNGQKTDDKDAEVLTDLLRSNFLPKVHLKSLVCREIKSILVQREFVVQSRVSMICHIRGILREYGITIEAGVKFFYLNAGQSIARLENKLIQKNLEILLSQCLALKSEELRIDQEIIEYVKTNNPEIFAKAERIEKIPGIGWTTALLMVSIIDDAKRFSDAHKFGAYLGLIPGQFSSGDQVRMGRITRSGCEMLRRYLIHGARAVLKYAKMKKSKNDIEAWSMRLVNKKGMNKATVAVAHKLARVYFALVRDEKDFVRDYKKSTRKAVEVSALTDVSIKEKAS